LTRAACLREELLDARVHEGVGDLAGGAGVGGQDRERRERGRREQRARAGALGVEEQGEAGLDGAG
jgi:hypothetical protein